MMKVLLVKWKMPGNVAFGCERTANLSQTIVMTSSNFRWPVRLGFFLLSPHSALQRPHRSGWLAGLQLAGTNDRVCMQTFTTRQRRRRQPTGSCPSGRLSSRRRTEGQGSAWARKRGLVPRVRARHLPTPRVCMPTSHPLLPDYVWGSLLNAGCVGVAPSLPVGTAFGALVEAASSNQEERETHD